MTELDERYDAFCCYNQSDRKDVEFVARQLNLRGGVRSFLDVSVEPGAVWLQRIQKVILASETFLLFVRCAPTHWQLRELNLAIELQTTTGKPYIIPVLLPNLVTDAFFNNPNVSFIRSSQAAQFTHSIQELDVIDGLARAIAGNSRVYVSSRTIPRNDKLPSGFQADLGRLTELLIGESVYKSRDICVRELIQNARDACSRLLAQHDQGLRNPEVIVRIDEQNRYFDVIDFGDGMSRDILMNSFSVLGKSLNDDFHARDEEQQELGRPVTGKFGIGFISTFMIADRIVVSTRASDDVPLHFAMKDPKTPFQYREVTACERAGDDVGTTIRVYLMHDYAIGAKRLDVRALTKSFCRHVPDLSLADGRRKHRIESDWNHCSDHTVIAQIATERYEIRLGWAKPPYDAIILSNGGFLVDALQENVLGKFPKGLVTGEVNVAPGLVDLNLSRDGVVSNDKVKRLRNIIGDALTQLIETSAKVFGEAATHGGSVAELAILAPLVRRAAVVLASLIKGGQIGLIPSNTSIDLRALYLNALVVELAHARSKASFGRYSYDTVRKLLTSGALPIVYAEQFSRQRVFQPNIVNGQYTTFLADAIVVQLPGEQARFQQTNFIQKLVKHVGVKFLDEEAAYRRYCPLWSVRGFRERWVELALAVVLGGLVVLGVSTLVWWGIKLIGRAN